MTSTNSFFSPITKEIFARFLGVFLAILIIVGHHAVAQSPSFLSTQLLACPVDEDYNDNNYRIQSGSCLYQPADGSITIQPQSLVMGQTTLTTWTPGDYLGISSAPQWFDNPNNASSNVERENPDNSRITYRAKLEPVDPSACVGSYSCLQKLVPSTSGGYFPQDGYYIVTIDYGISIRGTRVGEGAYETQIHIHTPDLPAAVLKVNQDSSNLRTFNLDATSSMAEAGINTYVWEATNNTGYYKFINDTATASITFPDDGSYTISLEISDNLSRSSSAQQVVVAGTLAATPTPAPTIPSVKPTAAPITPTVAPSKPGSPTITSVSSVKATVNKTFRYQVKATNKPTQYSVKGKLPSGLLFNTKTGLLSGKPKKAVTATLKFTAKNKKGSTTKIVIIVVHK